MKCQTLNTAFVGLTLWIGAPGVSAATLFPAGVVAVEPVVNTCPAPAVDHVENHTADPAQADASLGKARELVSRGDLHTAEEELLRALRAAPTANAWYELGAVRFAEGEAGCSLEAFTTAAAQRPPRAEDLRFVALDYVLLNDPASAEKWLRVALAQEPGNGEAWYDLGRVLYDTRRYLESADALHRALSLQPLPSRRRIRAITYLGLIAETNNEGQRAETDYRAAIAEQSSAQASKEKPFALPYRSLGVLLCEEGQQQEAVPLLEEATRFAPQDPVNHAELGACLARDHQWVSARDELQTAIQLHPSRPAWHFQLGRVLLALQSKAAAEKEFALAKSQIDVAPSEAPEQ